MSRFATPARTRAQKAAALCERLVMSRPDRLREFLGDHTVETLAQAHGVKPSDLRASFDHARRRLAHG